MTDNVHFINLQQAGEYARLLAQRAPGERFKWCLVFLKDDDYDPVRVNERLKELEFSFGQRAFETTVPASETGVFGDVDGECHLAFFRSVSETGLDEYTDINGDD